MQLHRALVSLSLAYTTCYNSHVFHLIIPIFQWYYSDELDVNITVLTL